MSKYGIYKYILSLNIYVMLEIVKKKEDLKKMSTLKAYETFDPLKSRKNNKEDERSENLTEEIKHKLKLIEKAFR